MNNAVRTVNLIVLAIVVIIGTQAPRPGGGSASTIGWWIGFSLVAISPAMSLFALSRNASDELRRHTRRITLAVLILFTLIGGCAMLSRSEPSLPMLVGLLLFCVPGVLTLWRLRVIDRGEDSAPTGGWFLGNYWRGEYSLGATVWAGSAMIFLVLFAAFAAFGTVMDRVTLVVTARLILGTVALITLVLLFQAVSVWRAATRSARERASPWPLLARLGVLAGVGAFGWTIWKYQVPQLREHALIALNRDPLAPLEVDVTTNGTVLLLHGSFGTGSAEKVRAVLQAEDGIRIVALASNGGRLREAADIAAMVRERKLDTYVDTRCESACTYVFLAGTDRAATPNARIGFHQPSFPGVNPLGRDFALNRMLGTYKDAGIPQDLLARIASTDASDMWYPTPQELQKAGVINRISLGGETSAIAALTGRSREDIAKLLQGLPSMVAMDRHFPGTIDEASRVAWVAHLQGHSDTAVNNATREVISARFPQILAAANDGSLDDFAKLLLEQMKAARDVNYEACNLLLLGKLNVEQVLPPVLVQRELQLTLDILETDVLQPRALVDPTAFQLASAAALGDMDEKAVDVVANPEGYLDQPELRCNSYIDFYGRVVSLPDDQRHLVLRGMFEMDED